MRDLNQRVKWGGHPGRRAASGMITAQALGSSMKSASRVLLSTAACALIAAVVLRAAPAPQAQSADQATEREALQKTLFVRVCVDCHDAERIESRRRTRPEWLDSVRQMIDEGADASDDESKSIVEFLLRNFGAVAINTARVDDLVTVLAISPKDADAIVTYRTANGRFTNLESIQKVPGIDIAQIERRKDSLRF